MSVVHYYRHAESKYNSGEDKGSDVDLSDKGLKQAEKLKGHYDMVVCSKMKRTKRTLMNSQITADNVMYIHLCREWKRHESDFLYEEVKDFQKETLEQLDERVEKFKILIETLKKIYPKIAVISHGIFIKRLTGVELNNAECYHT